MTDDELVAHVLDTGDAAAFGELVRRHEARIRALLRRLTGGDEARAEDLAQDSFLLAYRNLARFRREAALATWLVRIAVRRYLSDARRRRPQPLAESELPEVIDEAAVAPEAHLDLEHGLARIREEQRIALVLTHAYGFTHEEVAELTGWPLGTVKTHATRGRAALRTALTGDHE